MSPDNVKVLKRKKISLKKILILFLVLYIVGCMLYYLMTLPIKNIYITGTTHLKDYEIIEAGSIKKYPSIIKINSKTMVKKIKELELVEDVKIKKNLFGKISIQIREKKILFYNKSTNKIVFSDGSVSSNIENFYGLPTLVNYVLDSVYNKFIAGLSEIDSSALNLISEIEYSPIKKDDVIIDGSRFLFRMNDGNHVYVNILNISKFNNYPKIYSSFGDKKGVLYLDSNNEEASTFSPFTIDEGDTDEPAE